MGSIPSTTTKGTKVAELMGKDSFQSCIPRSQESAWISDMKETTCCTSDFSWEQCPA